MISQVASRYAEALFQLAEEENKTSEVYSEIFEMNDLIKNNVDLYDVLRSPFISRDEKKNVADRIFTDSVSINSRNFLMVLIDNNRTTELDSIVLSFKNMLNDKNNVSEGKVITAIALTEEQLSELESNLSAKYNRSIKLVNEISEDIIGGVLVKIGNEEIDGTLKTRLDSLKEVLSQVIS
ncbi:F0F1 ATP synthase subunit delta [Peptostreptococcus canis]|uniref:ATP synthase subunit delta n=1 Tax=Peptostreptococcus canis TaxID=1159213 RepID=A0ABR6TMY2_9FIRM|nr:F0F1 ATP synthase subunit delta [Peptostreptococcus canis]MBC2576311.1 F0F1 ATP synthase subunit delta [Peptostreptococcus canis]MBP1998509.1 F-type H+-transporting ATPase subunit delta [Peptostreptococcus canis]